MRYRLIWQVGLIIFVLGIMSIGIGAKGCSSADTSDLITGSSGYIKQPSPLPDCTLAPPDSAPDPVIYFGSTVDTGDFNGDGFNDLVVAAVGQKVFVYYSSASGFSTIPDWIAEPDQHNKYGRSIVVGDFNNDGFDDLAVGANKHSNGEEEEGAVFVYHGSASGLSATPNWTGEPNHAGAYYGTSVAAGDFDGDGFADLVVGAILYSSGQQYEGKVFVYHGSASGLSATPEWTHESNQAGARAGPGNIGDFDNDGFDDLSVLTDNGIYIYHGLTTGVSTTVKFTATCLGGVAGDFNNDGFDDFAVAVLINPSRTKIVIYYGSVSGLSIPSYWPVSYEASPLIYPGAVGDFNNDSFDDLVITARYATNGEGEEGKIWIHYGSASGLSTTFSWTGESNQSASRYGRTTAGDFNGDGFSDLAVGAESYDGSDGDRDRIGRVFIYYDVVGK